jgi:hypothetical protein
MGLKRRSLRPLNAFQGAPHIVWFAPGHFERCSRAEIVRRFIGPAKAAEHHAAEKIGPRVATAGRDRGIQRFKGGAIILAKERVNAATVQFLEQRVLRVGGRRHHANREESPRADHLPSHRRRSRLFRCELVAADSAQGNRQGLPKPHPW